MEITNELDNENTEATPEVESDDKEEDAEGEENKEL